MTEIFIDFETFTEPPRNGEGYNLKNYTIPNYVLSPKFKIHCASIAINDEPVQIYTGQELTGKLNEIKQIKNKIIIAHNYNFDGFILEYIYNISPTIARCTLSMFRAASYTDFTKSAELEECAKHFKFPEKIKGIILKTTDKTTEELQADTTLWNALCQYCINDTELCRLLYRKLLPEFTEIELDFQSMVLKAATQPRARIDTEILETEIRLKQAENKALMDEASAYWNNNTSKFYRSRLQQQELMKVYGLTSFDKTARLTAMANNPNDKALASYCKVLSSIQSPDLPTFKKLQQLGSIAEGIPLPVRISGAHTHRMSGSGGINFQNLPRTENEEDQGARTAIIPLDKTKCFIGADSSQIEARIAAWITNDEQCLNVIRNGIDVHLDMAVKMYPIGTYEEASKKLAANDPYVKQCRQIAKSANFGAQYGMGAIKFREFCFKNNVIISLKQATEAINKFRKARAPLVHFWNKTATLMFACLANKQNMQIGKFYVEGTKQRIILPDGQKMYYPGIRYWKKSFYVGNKSIWGGTLLENLTQASATSIMKLQLKDLPQTLKDNFVVNVHDAWVYSCPIEQAKEMEKTLRDALASSPNCCSEIPFKATSEIAYCLQH